MNLPRTFGTPTLNQMGGVDPITLSGFAPFTTYNCSVKASNSVRDGPGAIAAATTDEDCKKIELLLSHWVFLTWDT